jgi:hypothetical protein
VKFDPPYKQAAAGNIPTEGVIGISSVIRWQIDRALPDKAEAEVHQACKSFAFAGSAFL